MSAKSRLLSVSRKGSPWDKKVIEIMKTLVRFCILAAVFAFVTSSSVAQQRVHALSGTVTNINSKIRMVEVETDDGSPGRFEIVKAGTPLEFDKSLSADATAAEKFSATKAHVIVYYVGQGDVRVAVAFQPLGEGQLKTTKGTIVKFNRRDHLMSIKNDAGVEETFTLDAKTVADMETGVTPGSKADFGKGKPVRVTALQADGTNTALLIANVLW